ncbi:hypothetical protein ONZ45_g17287 [Pleurotus djamor]|nr:hypothetical protein ONZ45_g17287 [Pleurotus djamor]
MSPLTITFAYEMDDDMNILSPDGVEAMASALIPEIHRFEDVEITCDHSAADTLISSLLLPTCASPTPQLQRLKIGTGSAAQYDEPIMLETFWTGLTSLRSLELYGFLPVTAPPMPMLINLSISTGVIGNCLSTPWLVSLLQKTPNVEKVTIRTLSSNMPIPVSVVLPIVLPNLRFLDLKLSHLRESQILSYLEIPSSIPCYIRFNNQGHRLDPELDISPLQRFIASRVPSSITSLNVFARCDHNILRLEVRDGETESIILHLSVLALPPPFCEPNVLVGSLPLEKIQVLALETNGDTFNWSTFLPFLVNLKLIQVDDVAHLQSIAGNQSVSSPGAPKNVCNPNLNKIIVTRVRKLEPDDWARFICNFITRQKLGKPVQHLEIQTTRKSSMYHSDYLDDLKRRTKSEMIKHGFEGHIYWDSEEFGADMEGFDEVSSNLDRVE